MASTPLLRLSLPHHRRVPIFHPLLKPTTTTALRHLRSATSSPAIGISMSYNPTPAVDRLISAAAYTLPFLNSLHYGHHLLVAFPALDAALDPIIPLLALYRSLPYASFLAFFALYLGVVRNPALSRYARFNAMQALVLDVLLALPLLLSRILSPPRTGLVSRVVAAGHSALFVFVTGCFVYGVVSSVLGRTPHIPFVANAAGRQL